MSSETMPFAKLRDHSLERAVELLYSEELPYHNFHHALDTIRDGDDIVCQCQNEGMQIDPAIVYYALLFHDAGYHEDHRALGFISKEAYSAALAKKYLGKRGIAEVTAAKVADAILGTERDGKFRTVEEKAVRAADLSGMAANYERFYRNTVNLKKEQELLSGTEIDWSDWLQQVAANVEQYLAQEIELTRYFRSHGSESEFTRDARKNLAKLIDGD